MAADDRQDRRRRGVGDAPVCAKLRGRAVLGQVAGCQHEGRRSFPFHPVALDGGDAGGELVGIGHAMARLSQPVVVVGDHVRVGDMGEAEAVFGAPGLGLQREVHGEARTGVELQLPADERQALPTGRTRPVAVRRRDR